MLAQAIGPDPLRAKRLEMQAYAFGDIGRPTGEAFQEACLELLNDVAKEGV